MVASVRKTVFFLHSTHKQCAENIAPDEGIVLTIRVILITQIYIWYTNFESILNFLPPYFYYIQNV